LIRVGIGLGVSSHTASRGLGMEQVDVFIDQMETHSMVMQSGGHVLASEVNGQVYGVW